MESKKKQDFKSELSKILKQGNDFQGLKSIHYFGQKTKKMPFMSFTIQKWTVL
jgi:hypothetical protein